MNIRVNGRQRFQTLKDLRDAINLLGDDTRDHIDVRQARFEVRSLLWLRYNDMERMDTQEATLRQNLNRGHQPQSKREDQQDG